MRELKIECPGDAIIVGPVPRSNLKALDSLLREIQSYWLQDEFSTGDAIARPEVWNAIAKLVDLLPRIDAPGTTGFDLQRIENDYDYLERLFFGRGVTVEQDGMEINVAGIQPCLLHQLHRYNSKKKLREADQLRLSRQVNPSTEKSPRKTSRSKAQASKKQTCSPT